MGIEFRNTCILRVAAASARRGKRSVAHFFIVVGKDKIVYNHIKVTPSPSADQLVYGRDSFRKARKAHLIHKAKKIEPPGINKRDEL